MREQELMHASIVQAILQTTQVLRALFHIDFMHVPSSVFEWGESEKERETS